MKRIYFYQILFFLLFSFSANINSMKQTPVNIPEPVKKQLVQLLESERTKNPENLSKKSDHKLRQIMEICNTLLYRADAREAFTKLLKIDDNTLKNLLTKLEKRAQAALNMSKPQQTSAAKPASAAIPTSLAKPTSASKPIEKESKQVEEKAPSIPLWKAAGEGNLPAVEWYLAHGANVNDKSPGEESALANAAEKGHREIVSKLIKAGANLNTKNINGHSALHFALFQKHFDIVRDLIAAGADVNITDHHGETPLASAAMHGYEEMVKILLAAGANPSEDARNLAHRYPNIKKLLDDAEKRTEYTQPVDPQKRFIIKNGQTAPALSIWQAVAQGDWGIVLWHLTHGVDINAADENGETPLRLAFEYNQVNIMRELLKRGAQGSLTGLEYETVPPVLPTINMQNPQRRSETIWSAAATGDIESGIWFLNHGVNINSKNQQGETPLIVAAVHDESEVIQELVKAHALLNERDNDGNTALIRALQEKNIIIANMLLAAGADVKIQNNEGKGALAIAVARGLDQTVKDLLHAGASPQEKDEDDFTVLMLACYLERHSSNIIPTLIAAGADVNAKDDLNITALMVAASRNSYRAIKVLLDAGAAIDAEDVLGNTALDYAQKSKNQKNIDLLTQATEKLRQAKLAKKAVTEKPAAASSSLQPQPITAGGKASKTLIKAVRFSNPNRVRQLIKKDTDVNVQSKDGISLLQSAVMRGDKGIATLLLDHGANVNARDPGKGRTPLHWVVRMTKGSVKKTAEQMPQNVAIEELKLLLSRGADPAIKDNKGKTALEWARIYKLPALASVLEKAPGVKK